MKHTPYLDALGITMKENVPDHAANIIDHLLEIVNDGIDWGSYEGRRRKPCPEQPLLLVGMPIGQYHCPVCEMMIMAAMPHIRPGATDAEKNHPLYPLDDYEDEYQREWPPGYYPATGDPGDEG